MSLVNTIRSVREGLGQAFVAPTDETRREALAQRYREAIKEARAKLEREEREFEQEEKTRRGATFTAGLADRSADREVDRTTTLEGRRAGLLQDTLGTAADLSIKRDTARTANEIRSGDAAHQRQLDLVNIARGADRETLGAIYGNQPMLSQVLGHDERRFQRHYDTIERLAQRESEANKPNFLRTLTGLLPAGLTIAASALIG